MVVDLGLTRSKVRKQRRESGAEGVVPRFNTSTTTQRHTCDTKDLFDVALYDA